MRFLSRCLLLTAACLGSTLYVGAERSRPLIDHIVALRPKRVVFNPGSESAELQRHLEQKGIHYIHGCTLVMLRIGAF